MEIQQAIVKSGDQAYAPDNNRGYGIPNFTGVKNLLEASEIDDAVMIYPNPAASSLQVILKEPDGDPVTITIYNRLGQILSENTVSITWQNNPVSINMDALSQGLYLIKVKSASVMKTFKWVKV